MEDRHIELTPGICTWYSYRITEENRLNVYGTLNPNEDISVPPIGNVQRTAPKEQTHPIYIELQHPKEGPLVDSRLLFELQLTDTDAERLALRLQQYVKMWRGEITSVEASAAIKEGSTQIGGPTTHVL